jgi:hypothetical protein
MSHDDTLDEAIDDAIQTDGADTTRLQNMLRELYEEGRVSAGNLIWYRSRVDSRIEGKDK